ncbi:MAG: hypothetical protein ABIS67_15860 [Candidatus Eisenbacteria bacterium]
MISTRAFGPPSTPHLATPRRPALRTFTLALLLLLPGCATERRAPTTPETQSMVSGSVSSAALNTVRQTLAEVLTVQERYGDALLELYGVVGDGVGPGGDGRPVIKVFVTRSGLRIPKQIQGVPVEQEVTGTISAFSLTGSHRPLAIGVSAGNINECLPGTIGAVLRKGNRDYLLSCNHVFARQNQAALGETIVQPSRPDGSADCSPNPADAVGVLADFEPLDFAGGNNFIDAAIVEVALPPGMVSCATPAGFYGYPGVTPAAPATGLAIQKLGRTTELTRGSIKAINVKVKISYPLGVAKFQGVMLTSAGFGAFGDSGSLVVTDDGARAPVGLIFAGDAQGRAIVCPIGPVLARFGATICGS